MNAIMNSKSVRVTSDSEPVKKAIGKGDCRYWSQAGKLILDPRSRFFSCKIQVAGRRESFPLRTANKSEAASRAARIFGDVVALGWDEALIKHKPRHEKPKAPPTVGELILAVSEVADVRPATMAVNARAFRRIVADVLELDVSASRYAASGKGRKAWLQAVDAVPLSKITPQAVQAWKIAYLARAGRDEVKARSARNTANSLLRMSRSLFAKRVLRFIGEKLDLPVPLPFDGVELFPRQSMRYAGGVDVEALLTAARDELGGNSDRCEEWKVLLLCLFAGLRRNEADKLRWHSIDFARGVVRIEAHGDFAPKAETSLGEVPVDGEVLEVLRQLRANEPKAAYVLAGDVSRPGATYAHYRAADTFASLASWLRAHGVNSAKPLHTLRKEFGSLICQKAGLFAASRFLRHADTNITAMHYAAQKDRVTVGLGSLLSPLLPGVKPSAVEPAGVNQSSQRGAA